MFSIFIHSILLPKKEMQGFDRVLKHYGGSCVHKEYGYIPLVLNPRTQNNGFGISATHNTCLWIKLRRHSKTKYFCHADQLPHVAQCQQVAPCLCQITL